MDHLTGDEAALDIGVQFLRDRLALPRLCPVLESAPPIAG